jgi:hypothetical protein
MQKGVSVDPPARKMSPHLAIFSWIRQNVHYGRQKVFFKCQKRKKKAFWRHFGLYMSLYKHFACHVQEEQLLRCFTSFGGGMCRILAFGRVGRNSIAKFGDFFAKILTSRSEELPGNYRLQRTVLRCSWVNLVCRMATIPPDVFLT